MLKHLALPAIDAAVWDALNNGAPGGEPRIWIRESSHRAGSWSRSRRVVQVVVERPDEPIPGRKIGKREKGVNPFACNLVRLLLAGFGYQIMHVQRALLERVTGTGWSLGRLAERVLRTPARFNASGRRITMTTGGASAHWRMLARRLATLHGPSG